MAVNYNYNRWLSSRLTPVLDRLRLTPNIVTALGLFFGVMAGLSMAAGTREALLTGALLLHIAFVLDNCDGELARLQRRSDWLGRWFDVVADVCVDLALWTGLYLGCRMRGMFDDGVTIAWMIASAGSLCNFGMTLWERATGRSLSQHHQQRQAAVPRTLWAKAVRFAAHNGNSVTLAWPAALIGHPWVFLVGGAVFINALWAGRLLLNITSFAEWAGRVFGPILRWIGWGVAALSVYVLARELSWPEISRLFLRLGPAVLLVLAIYPVVSAIHMMGFYSLLPPATRAGLSKRRFFPVFLIGESVNKVTPFMDVGGEPLKVVLAARNGLLSASEAVATVYLSRVLFVITEIVFVVLGIGTLYFLKPSSRLSLVGVVAVVMSGMLALLFMAGAGKSLGYLAAKTAGVAGHSGDAAEASRIFDEAWKTRKLDIFVSSLWNTAGWTFLFLEVYLTLKLLGAPVSYAQAFVIQALLQAVKTVSFFVPANIGTQEGGLMHLTTHFGIAGPYGLAVSLVKRGRQFVWFALCLPFIPLLQRQSS